jgi:hypothetical protein
MLNKILEAVRRFRQWTTKVSAHGGFEKLGRNSDIRVQSANKVPTILFLN